MQNIIISTHTPLARRDDGKILGLSDLIISTHTPLARRDAASITPCPSADHFYSHASREA